MGRSSDAREKLIGVAFDLIWDSSYGSVSVDQICARAGVNKGSFYYFFGAKSDLAVAACEEHWRAGLPALDRLFSPRVPPLERLANWCVHVYDQQKEKAARHGRVCGCPYASLGVELATQDDNIRAKTGELMARTTKYLADAVAEAKRDGMAGVADPQRAAEQVFAFVIGSALQARIQNNLELLRDLEPTVLAMIGAPAETPSPGFAVSPPQSLVTACP